MRKRPDLYSLENIVAAINVVGPGMTDAQKREVLEKMTADVERLTAEAKDAKGKSGGAP